MSVPGGTVCVQAARRGGNLRGPVTHTDYRGPVQVRRAYKFRAYPTQPQEDRSAGMLADHCDLYNAALEERREAWRMRRASVPFDADTNGAINIATRAGLGSGQAAPAA